ncbi:unnamed protein product [Gadus morhua 'NCC']
MSAHCKVLVEVVDLNDNAPEITVTSLMTAVKEDAKIGTAIALVTVLDKDDGINGVVKAVIANDPPFKLQTNYKNYYSLVVNGPLDRETDAQYTVTIIATDEGSPPLSGTAVVTVHVSDVNDNEPRFTEPVLNVENIPYSAEAGYFVAKIRAVDADSGYNALLSYHISEPKGTNLFRIGTSTGEIRTKRRMSDNDLKTHPLVVLVCDNGEPSLTATVSIDVVVVENTGDLQTQFRHVPLKEDSFSALNLYLLIAIASVSVIFLLSLISLIAVKCHRTDNSFSRYSAPMITTHPDGSWSYSKSTQQYDVCFSSDTLKSDVVVFPPQFPPVDGELISINGGDTYGMTQTLPNKDKSVDSASTGIKHTVSLETVGYIAVVISKPLLSDEDSITSHENIPYSAEVGYFVAKIRAVDADSGYNALLSYHISEPKGTNLFRIGTSTGEIRTKRRMSDNDLKTHPLVVLVCDNGEPSLTATVSIDVVVVENTGDLQTQFRHVPLKEDSFSALNLYLLIAIASVSVIFLLSLISLIAVKCHRTDNSFSSENIPYSAEAGYFVAKIRAVDADSGYNALLSYHISEPKGTNLFRIGTSTGEIRTKRRMSDNDLKTHPLVVLVCDNGEPSLTATVSIDVVVVENTGDLQTQFRHVPLKEDSFSALNLYLLIAIASVSVIFLLSLICLIAVKCHRTDNSFSSENIPYSAEAGYFVAKIRAVDADSGYNALLSYHISEPKGTNLFRIGTSTGEIRTKRRMSDNDLKTHPLVVLVCDNGEPSLTATVSIDVVVVENTGDLQTQFRHVPLKEDSFSALNLYLLIAIASVSVIFLLSLISLIAVKCHRTDNSFSSENIPYSAEAGYFVAKIRAVDADSGYNALLSYHISEPKGTNLFRIGTSTGEIRTKRRMSDNDLKTHPLVVLVCDNGEPSLTAAVSIDVVVVENTGDLQTQFRHVPLKEDSFSALNLYLLIAIASVSVIFLLSLISLIAVKCHRTDNSFSRYSAPMITTHPDGSWSYSKSTQQYDVCFSSDTLKSDVVVFPPQFPPVDGELISINGGDTLSRTRTLPNHEKVC